MTTRSQSEFPVTSGAVPTVEGIVQMALDANGKAQSLSLPGSDKTVYPNIGATGVVIFETPPVAGLTSTQIAALSTTAIRALTSNCVIGDAANVGALTTTVINALTPGYIYDTPVTLTTTQLTSLTTSTIAALTSTQLSALSATAAIAQVPPTYGALQKVDLPISNMLAVAPVTGQTLLVSVRPK